MTDYLDFARLERPASPNTYLVAPAGLCQSADPDMTPPPLSKSARGLFSTLAEIIAAEKRWTNVEADPERLRFKFVARTPLLGFKDDIDIMILPPENAGQVGDEAASLAIYSRSRVGYSDLGANRKRVQALLDKLTTK